MAKRKNTTNHDIAAKFDNMLMWSTAMNDALIEALLCQQEMGNGVNNNFTSDAYKNIILEMREMFLDKVFGKKKIENRWKYIEIHFDPYFQERIERVFL